jgi:phosphate transport system protein
MNTTPQERGRRQFRDELDVLQRRLIEMAGIVEELVRQSVTAFLGRDASVSFWAKREDDRIDELETEIDDLALDVLALFQPMAKDLRHVVAVLKVSNDLERVGDHGVNIAKAAKRLSEMPGMPEVPELGEMAEIARSMLSDALAAYIARDSEAARVVCMRDEKVDTLRRSLYRILLTHMMEEPKRISPSLEILLVAQNLERVADLSTNIAEDVVFLVEGRSIKHMAESHPTWSEDDEAVDDAG